MQVPYGEGVACRTGPAPCVIDREVGGEALVNGRSLSAFRYHVVQAWLWSLRRRSQRHNMPWDRMNRIVNAWLPPAVISHPWPSQRFDVKYPRQEPSALAAQARICAGGAG